MDEVLGTKTAEGTWTALHLERIQSWNHVPPKHRKSVSGTAVGSHENSCLENMALPSVPPPQCLPFILWICKLEVRREVTGLSDRVAS